MKTKHKVTVASLLVAVLLSLPLVSWAGDLIAGAKPKFRESYGVQDQRPLENKIRHELVILPYFSVFRPPWLSVGWRQGSVGRPGHQPKPEECGGKGRASH